MAMTDLVDGNKLQEFSDSFKAKTDELYLPKSKTSSGKFLKDDNTYDTPPNTTYDVFTNSKDGLVPKPGVSEGKFLKDNGDWSIPDGKVIGIKGNSETAYRTGNVNLTLENLGAGAAASKDVSDSTSASSIGTSDNLVTERDVYCGLPIINGSHGYNSNTSLYAPTTVGTSGQVLQSKGNGAPIWGDIDSGKFERGLTKDFFIVSTDVQGIDYSKTESSSLYQAFFYKTGRLVYFNAMFGVEITSSTQRSGFLEVATFIKYLPWDISTDNIYFPLSVFNLNSFVHSVSEGYGPYYGAYIESREEKLYITLPMVSLDKGASGFFTVGGCYLMRQ